jgi:hypothetical protein
MGRIFVRSSSTSQANNLASYTLTVCSGDADEQVTVEFDVSLDRGVVVVYFEARYDVGECEVEFGVREARERKGSIYGYNSPSPTSGGRARVGRGDRDKNDFVTHRQCLGWRSSRKGG